MQVDLESRVALVTGAGRNTGEFVADRLPDSGARAVYSDVLTDEATAAANAGDGCVAKRLVANLTRAMALDLGPEGSLVKGIAPGSILTEGTKSLFPGEDSKFRDSIEKMIAHVPPGRPGERAEIACAALFIAAPESSCTNGHVVVVDGG